MFVIVASRRTCVTVVRVQGRPTSGGADDLRRGNGRTHMAASTEHAKRYIYSYTYTHTHVNIYLIHMTSISKVLAGTFNIIYTTNFTVMFVVKQCPPTTMIDCMSIVNL